MTILIEHLETELAFGRSPPLTEADHGGMR